MPIANQTDVGRRVGTAAQWTSGNIILPLNEIGIESDTGLIKTGDGTHTWTQLAYTNPTGTGINTNIPSSIDIFLGPNAAGATSVAAISNISISAVTNAMSDPQAAGVLNSVNAQMSIIGTTINTLETIIKNLGVAK